MPRRSGPSALPQGLLSLETVGPQPGLFGAKKGLVVVWGNIQRASETVSTARPKNAHGRTVTLSTGEPLAQLGQAPLQVQKQDSQPVW